MDLVVAADDRTGAFEVAGRLADEGAGTVTVVAWPATPGDGTNVVDLGSRHLSPGEARERALGLNGGRRRAHKIDSTLRGNWADELVGRSARSPVLVVPALPAFGRTCVGGQVLDHGRPVHEGAAGTDVRRRVTSSRPAALLRSAGAELVVELADRDQRSGWWQRPVGIAVADAASEEDIVSVVGEWADHGADVVLAGTSAVVGRAGVGGDRIEPEQLGGTGPVLVVCGSVHPASRDQLAFCERRGVPIAHLADDITARQLSTTGTLVLASEIPVGDVDEPMAVAAAASLARGVADLRRRVDLGALIIIGGDTAAAVLGASSAAVHGSAGPGTGWATLGDDPLPVITRSGGFGGEAALDELIRSTRAALGAS